MPGLPTEEDVLALVDVLATHELGDEPLVDRGAGREVEVLEVLHGREASGLQPSFGGALLALQQLELAELEQVAEVVLVVGRGLHGDLLGLGTDRREPQCLQVVVEEHERLRFEGLHCHAPCAVSAA